jgi:hypothetical protein
MIINKIKQLLKFNYDSYKVTYSKKLNVYYVEIYLNKYWIFRKFEKNINNLNTHLTSKQLRKLKTSGKAQFFTTNSY